MEKVIKQNQNQDRKNAKKGIFANLKDRRRGNGLPYASKVR